MTRTKKIIFQSGLLLCMANLAHAAGLPADQADSQQTDSKQTSDEQTTQATAQAPQQTTTAGTTATTTATGQAPGTPPGTLAPTGMPPGTLAPAGTAPATLAPAATTVETPSVKTAAGVVLPAMILPATAAPGTVGPNGAYVPRTQYDNTPYRFNMTQEGKRMSANDFDAWMRAKGYRVATGRPPSSCPNVPPAGVQTIVGPDGCPVEVSIDLQGVTFEFAKATLRKEAKKTLDQAVEILKRHSELTVEVAGHTDSKGADELNQKLSEKRAKAVYDYLVKNGIAESQLEGPIGYGESKPIASNDTDEGREKNRRTELNIKATSEVAGTAPAAGTTPGQAAAPAAGQATTGTAEAQSATAPATAATPTGTAPSQPTATGQTTTTATATDGNTAPATDADKAEDEKAPEDDKTPR